MHLAGSEIHSEAEMLFGGAAHFFKTSFVSAEKSRIRMRAHLFVSPSCLISGRATTVGGVYVGRVHFDCSSTFVKKKPKKEARRKFFEGRVFDSSSTLVEL